MRLKYLGIGIFIVLITLLYFMVNPSTSEFFPKCLLFTGTGIYCPGCGSQRATHDLLNGNLLQALDHNLMFVVGLLIIAYHLVVTALNKWFGKRIYNYLFHPKTPIYLLVFIILFWVLRNIDIEPLIWLGPD